MHSAFGRVRILGSLILLACSSPSPSDGGDAAARDASTRDAASRIDGEVVADAAGSDGGCVCEATHCCVGGSCVPLDEDGDGYRRAECGGVGAVDCDDRDPGLSPFPPRDVEWTPHGDPRALRDLSVVATASDCALAVYLVEDGSGTIELAHLADSGATCSGGVAPGPIDITALPCGTGNLTAAYGIDLALRGGNVAFAVGGPCSSDSSQHIVLTRLDGSGPRTVDEFSLDGALDLSIMTGVGVASMAIRETDGEVKLVTSTGFVSLRVTSTGDWLDTGADVVLYVDNAILTLQGSSASTLREESGLTSRAALVDFGTNTYGVLVHRGSGELAMVGPLTGANGLDVVNPPIARWPTGAPDARLDAVALDDTRFVVIGSASEPVGIRMALGRRASALSIDDVTVLDNPGDGSEPSDLAITAFASPTRTEVWVAATTDGLYSTHFSICPDAP